PVDLARFFQRWTGVIPTPLTQADRAAGYWWELSMRQVEVLLAAPLFAHRLAGFHDDSPAAMDAHQCSRPGLGRTRQRLARRPARAD
ncbi:MAG: hypothetical protein LC792_26125, partial [Actinobacteria bacterium]|nr:hypothetical protein [Actinomycetota bacterium]